MKGNIMEKLISVIVPCYNEEESVPLFYEEMNRITTTLGPYQWEYLFVDDGSKDRTLDILQELAEQDDRISYLSFSRNFGKESAVYAGLCNARGDYVVVMDADLQHPPAMLKDMIAVMEEGVYDSAAARRVSRKNEPPIRSFFARMFYKIINKISDADIVDGACDFRMMGRDMVQAIVEMGEYNRFSKGIFGWVGFRTKWLPYENVERVAGETKWSFWGLFRYSIDGIVNFSNMPLSIASWTGGFFTIVAFLMILWIILKKLLFGDPVAGWPSLACMIAFFGGIQLLCIGIMGQYIAKTYLEVKERPHYIIGKTNRSDVKRIG